MSFYKLGENFHWFIARVSDIKDPEYLGRVRIRIIHEQTGQLGKFDKNYGIDDGELLWAWPMSSIQSASLSWKKIADEELEGYPVPDWIDAVGSSPTGIAIGTYVIGFYLDGREQNIPMIMGTYHKKSIHPEPPSDGANKMLQLKEPEDFKEFHDVSSLARGEAGEGGQTLPKDYAKGTLVVEPKSAYDAEYPYNFTYTTKSGHAIEIDDTPGAERIHIWHKSGSYEEINQDGRRVIKTNDDHYEIITGDKKTLIKGSGTFEVEGNIKIVSNGNTTIETSGDTNINTTGKTDVFSIGETTVKAVARLNLRSDTKISVRAPSVDIN